MLAEPSQGAFTAERRQGLIAVLGDYGPAGPGLGAVITPRHAPGASPEVGASAVAGPVAGELGATRMRVCPLFRMLLLN